MIENIYGYFKCELNLYVSEKIHLTGQKLNYAEVESESEKKKIIENLLPIGEKNHFEWQMAKNISECK